MYLYSNKMITKEVPTILEMIRETSLLLSYFNVSGTLPLSHAVFLIYSFKFLKSKYSIILRNCICVYGDFPSIFLIVI